MRGFTLIVLCAVALAGCSRHHRGEFAKALPAKSVPKSVLAIDKFDIRFGLTEPQRKQIFDQLMAREDVAHWMAAKKYPLPRLKDFLTEGNSGDKRYHSLPESRYYVAKMAVEKKRAELYAPLDAKHRKELAANHSLSVGQINEIYKEGWSKHWPLEYLKPSILDEPFLYKDKNWNKSGRVLIKQT